MELITILNRCHHFRGFVYHRATFSLDHKTIEISVRPRKGSSAVCSRCHQPAPGYDQLAERRFEFIPLWGFFVFLLYAMRRVDCRRCGAVIVEEVPWGDGKRTLTRAYMLFLARWARRLSWKETSEAFRTSWEKVFDAVEHVVTWGLEHRTLGQIDAIGVDEIQYAKGHKYLTLVYQIDMALMQAGRRGEFDAVVVWRFDRFARSIEQLVLALAEFRALGIDFVSCQEALDTSTPMGKAMFTIIGAMAELERNVIRERVVAGMNYARHHGTKTGNAIGRPKRVFDRSDVVRLRDDGLSIEKIARQMRLGVGTVVRVLQAQ